MILGTGIDLVEVDRIASSFARFAAKEAVSKAFGTGIGTGLGWHDIEVVRKPSGEPCILMHGPGERLLVERGATRLHLSLTHTAAHAAAVAILEG